MKGGYEEKVGCREQRGGKEGKKEVDEGIEIWMQRAEGTELNIKCRRWGWWMTGR